MGNETHDEAWAPLAADRATVAHLLDDVSYPAYLTALGADDYVLAAANRAALQAFDRTWDDLRGRLLAEVITDAEALAAIRQHCDEVVDTGRPVIPRLHIDLPGGRREYETTLVPVTNGDGRCCTHVLSVWRDVTSQRQSEAQREQTERALRESEARSRAILQATPDIVVTVRRDGTVMSVDGQVLDLVEAPDGAVGTRISDIYPAESTERIIGLITGALDTGELHTDEILVDFDGTELLIEARIVPLGPDLALGIGRDVTGRKVADQALRDSEQRFRLLATDAPVGIFQTDAEGRCVFVNSYWCDRAGISAEDALGDGWSNALHPDDRERVFEEWNAGAAAGRTFDLNYRFVTPDGEVSWLSGHGVPLRDGNGTITGYLGTILDISERQQAEQLRAVRVEAEQLVSAISRRVLTTSRDDIDGVIEDALQQAGSFVGASAATLDLYSEDGSWVIRSHLWATRAAEAVRDDFPDRYPALPEIAATLSEVDHLVVDIDDLPNGSHEPRAALAAAGVRGIGMLPVRSVGRVTGFIAFTWHDAVPEVVGTVLPTLRVLADVFVAALDRTRTERERIKAEESLRRSEERFRALVQNSSDMVTVLDADGVVQYTSPASLKILGLDGNEQVGALAFDRVHPDDVDAVTRVFTEALAKPGPTDPVQVRLRHEDGSWRTIEAVGTNLLHDPAVEGLVVNGRDVTERIRLEEHFGALVQNTSDMITVLDVEGRIVYSSPAAERTLGWHIPDWLGRQVFDLVHPDDLDLVGTRFLEAVSESGLTDPVEFRMRRADGSWCYVEAVGNSLFHDPSVEGMVVTARDVTDRKRLEAQLLQAQKMEAVGQLAGGVAHDFNNLLTAITGYTALLLDATAAGDPRREDLEEIAHAGTRATKLVDQLLSFSRRRTVQPTELDLGEVVESMRSLVDRVLPADIEVVTELSGGLDPVEADRSQVEQVLMNLVVNARDAMPEGGRLVIETTTARLDDHSAAAHVGVVPGEYVLLAVSDDGVGMDAATRARVFEPFFTTKDVGEGTGLGLSTVYGIVTQAGGQVTVYSEPGRGTTFRVYFPSVEASAGEPSEPPATISDQPGGTETVLLVEDEPAVRTLASHVLTRLGYSVLEASDGQRALEVAAAHDGRIDLLVTDVVLPRASGIEVAEKLTADFPHLRVLFMSGYTETAIGYDGELDGHFLPKPFQPADLTNRVREILDGLPSA